MTMDYVCQQSESIPGCDLHGHMMVKRNSRFGGFYACPTWNYTQCDRMASYSKHNSKWHLSDKETRQIRIRGHHFFDQMWQRGCFSRGRAYQLLAHAMRLPRSDCHIQHFSIEQCKSAIQTACEILEGFGVEIEPYEDGR